MFSFFKQLGNYAQGNVKAARYIGQGMTVTFDHMRRRPVTMQYPYEKLLYSTGARGRIHFEIDKCIACEVCVRVCPINLPVVNWEFNQETKRKQLKHYSIDFAACVFCGNCVQYCPTHCLSHTEEYELGVYDRHTLNYDDSALAQLPDPVSREKTFTPLQELTNVPNEELRTHEIRPFARRASQRLEEIKEQIDQEGKNS